MAVQRRAIDDDIRVLFGKGLDALWRDDKGHHADLLVAHAVFVQHIARVDQRIAGGQHGIDDDIGLALRLGQFHKILNRFFRVVIAVHADMPDAGGGDELKQGLRHAKTRA